MRSMAAAVVVGVLVALAVCKVEVTAEDDVKRPHIVVIVADDLGWNDVGFHGSDQIATPNLDALAYSGVLLHDYYVNPICTPSRSALLTGLHPIHTGLQSGVLVGAAPYALPLDKRLLPEFLNDLGYVSHAVGKWHLGSHRAVYTPTMRGFKSHLGYWTGHEDYYDHTAQELYEPVEGWGYDFRHNLSVSWSEYGSYATDVFTAQAASIVRAHNASTPLFLYLAHLAVHSANTYSPLQAPKEAVDRFPHISDPGRRAFAGMLSKLDDSVGAVTAALSERNMLRDSVIVFTTDNGGAAAGFNDNQASNWPLRGVKDTLFEGGVRGAGFLWAGPGMIKARSRVARQMMNVQDWTLEAFISKCVLKKPLSLLSLQLPTLYTAAGGKSSKLPFMDGLDLWRSLTEDTDSPRNIMLHNIDENRHIAAVRVQEWKFMKGTTYNGAWDGWYGPSGRNESVVYDINRVLSSPAAAAVAKAGVPMPSFEAVWALRKQTEIDCSKKKDSKPCKPTQQVCLFNITADPCELNNLAFVYPDAVRLLEQTLETFQATAVPPGNKPIEERADPRYFDYTWTNWLDFYEPSLSEEESSLLESRGRSDPEQATEADVVAILRQFGVPEKLGNMENNVI